MRISDWSSDVCSSDLHTAIKMHPPVHSAFAHLTFKVGTLLGRNAGIVRAQADQHLALDVSGVLRPGGRKAAVKDDDAAHIRAASRPFQRHGAAKAESDRSDPAGVHCISHAQVLEATLGRPEERRVGREGVRKCRSRWWPY